MIARLPRRKAIRVAGRAKLGSGHRAFHELHLSSSDVELMLTRINRIVRLIR